MVLTHPTTDCRSHSSGQELAITNCDHLRPSVRLTFHTNPNAATNAYTRDTVWKSTGGGNPGRSLQYRTYSTHVRSYKTSGHPCGATSRTAGSGCEGRRVEALLLVEVAIQDNRLVTREGGHVPILWPSPDAWSGGRLPFDLVLFGAYWARSDFHARSRTTGAAYVQKEASCIVPSRSRSRAPLFPQGCETGTGCPCTCARWGPCT